MIDNEIIKALECCANWESDKSCEECPANTYGFSCANKMAKHYLNLINRQKLDIERMEKELTEYKLRLKMSECTVDEIKSDAIKEFAERLSKEFEICRKEYKNVMNDDGACAIIIAKSVVVRVAKEMTEEDEIRERKMRGNENN